MLHLIVAPYHLGQRAVTVGAGPLRVQETGVAALIEAKSTEIDVGTSCEPTQVNQRIAAEVSLSLESGFLPLVVAGNCNSCLGTLAGLVHLRPGILWFDAHGDFHTPETTVSGSLEGMSLTLATQNFVLERNVVLAGARDLDPGEDERVRKRLLFIPDACLSEHALPEVGALYIHIDVDVLDPSISPGANFQGPGGLSVATLLKALAFAFERYNVAAVAIVNYNPANDSDHTTRDIVVQLIKELAGLRRAVGSR